jgi:CubicO group peptidase (beta-lactamase class C family)
MPGSVCIRWCSALAMVLAVSFALPLARADQGATVHRLADQFAGTVVDDGAAIGVGVGIVIGNHTYFYSYGNAVAGADRTPALPFTPDTIFQIGSTTKVFTTNLLGQEVRNHTLRLADPLSSLSGEIGLLAGMQAVTLEELGDFTAGLPQYAPLCKSPNVPVGCLPNDRPSLQQYSAADFLAFFAGFAAPKLPAAYLYSDFSTGLLGLLLSGSTALDNHAVDLWFATVRQRLLEPLGMRSTYLYVPAEARGRTASGYQLALALPVVSNGGVNNYDMISGGALYTAPPAVQVRGGPGGATAAAKLEDGHVASLTPGETGANYRPPMVKFGQSSTTASGEPVIVDGRVVAVKLVNPGADYSEPPEITFNTPERGRQAHGTAHIALGQLSYVSITDGGSGYQSPVSVRVGAPHATSAPVPIWAAAGALSSTVHDMVRFTQAALGHTTIDGHKIAPAITEGFRIAMEPRACQASDPSLQTCGPTQPRSALAWGVVPEDKKNRVPEIIVKDGGIGGFSSEVRLMPARDMAVVVFANARGLEIENGNPTQTAERIADNLLYALFYTLKH